jgi:hypothetical protein
MIFEVAFEVEVVFEFAVDLHSALGRCQMWRLPFG